MSCVSSLLQEDRGNITTVSRKGEGIECGGGTSILSTVIVQIYWPTTLHDTYKYRHSRMWDFPTIWAMNNHNTYSNYHIVCLCFLLQQAVFPFTNRKKNTVSIFDFSLANGVGYVFSAPVNWSSGQSGRIYSATQIGVAASTEVDLSNFNLT